MSKSRLSKEERKLEKQKRDQRKNARGKAWENGSSKQYKKEHSNYGYGY